MDSNAFNSDALKIGRSRTRDKSSLFSSLYETIQEPAWVIDLETSRFLDANGAAVSQLDYALHEILSMGVTDINRAVPDEQVWRELTRNLRENDTISYSAELVCKSGKAVEVEISLARKVVAGQPVFLAVTRSMN